MLFRCCEHEPESQLIQPLWPCRNRMPLSFRFEGAVSCSEHQGLNYDYCDAPLLLVRPDTGLSWLKVSLGRSTPDLHDP